MDTQCRKPHYVRWNPRVDGTRRQQMDDRTFIRVSALRGHLRGELVPWVRSTARVVAPVGQGIERWFPKQNYGAHLPLRKPSKFLAMTRKWPSLMSLRELENHPLFPTIPGNCCAEVVLGI